MVQVSHSSHIMDMMYNMPLTYRGPAFIPYLDNLPTITREDEGPFRMPIADKFKVIYIYIYMYMY